MPDRTHHRAARPPACLAVVVVASLCVAWVGAAWAGQSAVQPPAAPPVKVVASEFGSNFVPLGIGKSVVVDVPRDIKDVLVADPKIANAVVRTSRRAYLIGAAIGQTSVFFFDADGRQLAGFDIAVTRDLNGMRAALKQMFPEGNVHVEGIAEGVMLSGAVATPNLATNGTGIGQGQAVLNFVTSNPFTAALQNISGTNITGRFSSVTATMQAMERAGVIRTLAEPTLTAVSGESATFLAGGEFPVPGGAITCTSTGSLFNAVPYCLPIIEFKKFGVSMQFTPVVLGAGKISLKVMTEVSDLSADNSITLNQFGSNTPVTIPSLRVRRAETSVEIPSGGALAMAGMIHEQTLQSLNGLPGLMDVPILGALFRSRDYLNRQTELMILVAPYVVHAVASKELARPDDGYADAPDPSAILLGRLNRIYGGPGAVDAPGPYRGTYGFIID